MDINDILRHEVALAQLERNGFNQYIKPSLADALREIRRLLADVDTITNRRQLQALETAIENIIQRQQGWAVLTNELTDLAIYESDFYGTLIGAGTTDESLIQLLAANTMLVLRSGERFNSGLWADFITNELASEAAAVNNIVRTGYANGLTGRAMRGQINNLFDGMITRHAETLATTGYAHYAQVGRRAFAEANPDIVIREIPIVTFDSRTSDTCLSVGARYGEKGWPVGQAPNGYPPFHFRCRTTVVPATEDGITGTRASVGDTVGQIDAKTTLTQFVRNQSKSWQDRLLGPERAKLFRDGKLELRNLTDRNLQPRTLDELRENGE